jgi:hypothetical protein
MRTIRYALPLLLLSLGILMADDSQYKGKWKMNHSKSKANQGSIPRNENMNIADQGGQIKVTIVGTNDDGTPIAISYVIPADGGAGQMQQGGSYDGVSTKMVDDTTRDTTYTNNGKQLVAEHMVVSSDGNTMTVTVKGVDANGNPVDKVLVFEKQPQ